ncbi:MAG: gliding motility-associated C-terminal domain-containing protein [bacterium]|nr:gliding motility-associated C-terminal domain-containing protein [bacterium]
MINSTVLWIGSNATICGPTGNLLFYSNGVIIKNQSQLTMANGTGLHSLGGVQGVIIVKKPGSSNLYYVFTLGDPGGSSYLKYSIVDMTLAAGQGSVTIKNNLVSNANCSNKLTGAYHCNGKDVWIVTHDYLNNSFRSYLLTSTGLNTVAVVSNSGYVDNGDISPMKISSSGNKLAACFGGSSGLYSRAIQLFDFNSSSGTVTNPIPVWTQTPGASGTNLFGVDFSPDNSKLYATGEIGNFILQFDICAGSIAAIQTSKYAISYNGNNPPVSLQTAVNEKIYVTVSNSSQTTNIHVIDSPNGSGASCNFMPFSQGLAGKNPGEFLPNLFLPYKHVISQNNISYSVAPLTGCHAITFTSNTPSVSCAASNFSVASMKWDFGDLGSGLQNSSTLSNPTHQYPAAGPYSVTLVYYYNCGSDTIHKVITVPPPYVNTTAVPGCGNSSGSATISAGGGIGPYTYTWIPGNQNGSQVSNLNSGTYTVLIFDQGLNCKASTTLTINNFSAPPVSVSPSSLVTLCLGTQSTVTLQNYTGSYSWKPSAGLSSSGNGTLQVSSQLSQVYTITINTSSCSSTTLLNVQVKALPIVSVSADKTLACANSSVFLFGSGGVSYIWKFSETDFAFGPVVAAPVAAQWGNIASYTLIGIDANGCSNTAVQTISVLPAPNGVLVIPKEPVCAPAGGSFLFVATSPTSNVSSTWLINGQTSSGMATYYFQDPGVYTFTGTITDNTNLCSSVVYPSITVYQKPKADFTYSPLEIREELDEVVFTATGYAFGNESNSTWYFIQGSKKFTTDSEQTTYIYKESGIFPVTLVIRDENGCADTITKAVTVIAEGGIYVPNSFTPNEDGLNDIFKPIITGSKKYKLNIYDRWGALIFETANYETGWDGTYKGEPSKSDIYTWTLQSSSVSGNISKTGSVLLLR